MIAVVRRTRGIHYAGFVEIESLPQPPALRYCGFLIECTPAPAGLIEWIQEVRATRERLSIGAVVDPGDPLLFTLAKAGMRLGPLISAAEAVDGRILIEALYQLRDATVEGLVLEAWLSRRMAAGYDNTPEIEDALSAVVAVGSTGAGVPSLVRHLELTRTEVYRLFEDLGLPPPGAALRRARHEVLEIRVEKFGMDEALAREATGWLNPRAYEIARYRWRRRGTNCSGK